MKNFLLGLLAALLVVVAFAQSKPEDASAWEYRMLVVPIGPEDSWTDLQSTYEGAQKEFDALGKDGWELVLLADDVVGDSKDVDFANRFVFKRRRQ